MEVTLDINIIFAIVGTIQGIILIFLIKKIPQFNKEANKKLVYLLVIATIALAGRVSYNYNFLKQFPHILLLLDIALFTYGPLLYFYICDLVGIEPRYKWKKWVYFIPFIIHSIVSLYQVLISKEDYFTLIMSIDPVLYGVWFAIEGLSILFNSFFLYLNHKLLKDYEKKSSELTSIPNNLIYLKLLNLYTFIFLLAWTVGFIMYFIVGLNPIAGNLWFILFILIYIVSYYAIKQPEIFKIKPNEIKYTNIQVDDNELNKLNEKLMNCMKEEKPFLNNNLTLNDLALLLDIKPYLLSRIINEKHNKNFSDFINQFRVDEFVVIARKNLNRNYTLLAIAYEAGFNSKTSFNKFFKKFKNTTPSKFISMEIPKN